MMATVETEDAAVRVRPLWSRTLGWSLILIAVGFLCWSAWAAFGAWSMAHEFGSGPGSGDGAFGRDRDRVVRAARQQLAVLNSMDSGRADAVLQQWLAASGGGLHDELQRDAAANRLKIQQAGTVAVGSARSIAVTSLDERAGSAQVIAAVRIQLTPRTGDPSTQARRYEATLQRTSGAWRLTSLTALPAGSA